MTSYHPVCGLSRPKDNNVDSNSFFLWGFAYGLLDVLNKHFQSTLNITASRSSGLQAAYFGAYFLCPLTISGWIVRKFGFRVTFMTGKLEWSGWLERMHVADDF